MSDRAAEYDSIIDGLRAAYDGGAAARDEAPKSPWKLAERAAFLHRLQAEGKRRLLEIGAGTGHDAAYFQRHGLRVVATDLSPQMVARCRAKGVEAYVMDFLNLDFPPASFDGVYALNCLLHVPTAGLQPVLSAIRELLVPGGIFFLGTYGGEPFEGALPEDSHDPPRFFSFRTDEEMQDVAAASFDLLDFRAYEPEGSGAVAARAGAVRFQSLTLRAPR